MNLKETESLLKELSAIDGRQITADRIKAWQGLLEMMPLDIALEAHKMARRDESIGYLEPKHIIAKAKEAAMRMEQEERRQQAMSPQKPVYQGIPAPKCKHGGSMPTCNTCCRELSKFHARHPEKDYGDPLCVQFARENLYA